MTFGKHRRLEALGPFGSCLTLAWLATHRDRLRTLLFGGKRLSVLIVWDTKGAALVDHDDVEVDALARIVYGPPWPRPETPSPGKSQTLGL